MIEIEKNPEELNYSYLCKVPLKKGITGSATSDCCQAMVNKMKPILKNDTWTIVDRPKESQVIESRMTSRNKYKAERSFHKRKARLVPQGFSQVPGVHFIRDELNHGNFKLEHVSTENMVADVLKKYLTKARHKVCTSCFKMSSH